MDFWGVLDKILRGFSALTPSLPRRCRPLRTWGGGKIIKIHKLKTKFEGKKENFVRQKSEIFALKNWILSHEKKKFFLSQWKEDFERQKCEFWAQIKWILMAKMWIWSKTSPELELEKVNFEPKKKVNFEPNKLNLHLKNWILSPQKKWILARKLRAQKRRILSSKHFKFCAWKFEFWAR